MAPRDVPPLTARLSLPADGPNPSQTLQKGDSGLLMKTPTKSAVQPGGARHPFTKAPIPALAQFLAACFKHILQGLCRDQVLSEAVQAALIDLTTDGTLEGDPQRDVAFWQAVLNAARAHNKIGLQTFTFLWTAPAEMYPAMPTYSTVTPTARATQARKADEQVDGPLAASQDTQMHIDQTYEPAPITPHNAAPIKMELHNADAMETNTDALSRAVRDQTHLQDTLTTSPSQAKPSTPRVFQTLHLSLLRKAENVIPPQAAALTGQYVRASSSTQSRDELQTVFARPTDETYTSKPVTVKGAKASEHKHSLTKLIEVMTKPSLWEEGWKGVWRAVCVDLFTHCPAAMEVPELLADPRTATPDQRLTATLSLLSLAMEHRNMDTDIAVTLYCHHLHHTHNTHRTTTTTASPYSTHGSNNTNSPYGTPNTNTPHGPARGMPGSASAASLAAQSPMSDGLVTALLHMHEMRGALMTRQGAGLAATQPGVGPVHGRSASDAKMGQYVLSLQQALHGAGYHMLGQTHAAGCGVPHAVAGDHTGGIGTGSKVPSDDIGSYLQILQLQTYSPGSNGRGAAQHHMPAAGGPQQQQQPAGAAAQPAGAKKGSFMAMLESVGSNY